MRARAPAFPAATSKVERMLALAADRDLWAMEQVRRRLAAHEQERWHSTSPRRRPELDQMIAFEIETPCKGFVKLERALGRQPTT